MKLRNPITHNKPSTQTRKNFFTLITRFTTKNGIQTDPKFQYINSEQSIANNDLTSTISNIYNLQILYPQTMIIYSSMKQCF